MKLLISLWWTQKRRMFRWMEVFVGCYFAFLFSYLSGDGFPT